MFYEKRTLILDLSGDFDKETLCKKDNPDNYEYSFYNYVWDSYRNEMRYDAKQYYLGSLPVEVLSIKLIDDLLIKVKIKQELDYHLVPVNCTY